MSYPSLLHFINELESKQELQRVSEFVSPELEVSEIADRMAKSNGKALLFENNGTEFPVLINAFGSNFRMLSALGLKSYSDFEHKLDELFDIVNTSKQGKGSIVRLLQKLKTVSYSRPECIRQKGKCFEVRMTVPDLGKIPVLKCWPHDGGKFVTLPMVHTVDPDTGQTNIGMYRMQVFGSDTTGMHWHRHKGGAAHFEKYRSKGMIMPVVVTLGGDPVYTYSATAPLPEIISEYAFAGFLRQKRVRLVKCLSCDIRVPEDVDFVLEGYIDPAEDVVVEGPFGDHTGFYSLPDTYPVFHITHISHRRNAIYPATIVGIPPMEDAFMGEATERLFLPLIKRIIAPEICDMFMPSEGGFHNLAIVSIKNSYPGQAIKVMNALWGAGQMMFVKNIVIVDENVNVHHSDDVMMALLKNVKFPDDFHFMYGPLDVLDHANTSPSYGKKMGIDATQNRNQKIQSYELDYDDAGVIFSDVFSSELMSSVVIAYVDKEIISSVGELHRQIFSREGTTVPLILYLDKTCEHLNLSEILWMFLANFDPANDIYIVGKDTITHAGFDGTMKKPGEKGIHQYRPNIIVMDEQTIRDIDSKWKNLNIGNFIESPSIRYKKITLSEGYLYDK